MDYKRPDGRLPNELREIIISFDGLNGVDGSARFGFGDTKAVASVSGPVEVRLAVEQANKATFEVIVRPLAGLPGTDSKALASSLRNALLPSMILTNNPRTLVQLVALSLTPVPSPSSSPSSSSLESRARRKGRNNVLRTSPALISSLINASSLALLNASSIPLRGVICAISIGRVRVRVHAVADAGSSPTTRESTLLVDPSESELSNPDLSGTGVFAFLVTTTTTEPNHPPSSYSHPSQQQKSTETETETETTTTTEKKLKAELVWSHINATSVPFDEADLVRATELARIGALRVWEGMREGVERVLLFGLGSETRRGIGTGGGGDGGGVPEKVDVKVKVKKEDVGTLSVVDDEKMEIS